MSFLNGHLLIASPRLVNSFFSKTVILVLAHSVEGAAGLVINRPTEATVSDLSQSIFKQSFLWEKPIWLGGPLAGPLVVLHQSVKHADHEVVPGVFSTVKDDKVREALKKRLDPALVAINYAGWGPGQLEEELATDTWETIIATKNLVFPTPGLDLWKTALQLVQAQKLQSFLRIPEVPADPSWN